MHSHVTLVPKSLTLHMLEKGNRFQAPLCQGLSQHQMMDMLVEGQTGTRQKLLARKPNGGLGEWLPSNWFVLEFPPSTWEKQEKSRTAFS